MLFTRSDDPFNARRAVILAFAILFFVIATAIGYNQEPTRDPFIPDTSWKNWAWWKEPVERNAFRRLASVGATLSSIQFMEGGKRGWAVGEGGIILATEDGGGKWFAQNTSVKAWLSSVHFLADGQRGWAVGMEGTILTTVDGGRNWEVQKKGDVEEWLRFVHVMDDGQHGWAVGVDGVILATEDGGRNWIAQNSGVDVGLRSAYFLMGGQRGWVVGDDGAILATSDSGRSWVVQNSGINEYLSSVHFLADGQHGWVVGMEGRILATEDGGRNWVAQDSGTKAGLYAIKFLDNGQRGWAVGDGGIILTTEDGGFNWVVQNGGIKRYLYSVHFLADGQRGWVAGEGGAIHMTSDGGRNWVPQNSGIEAWIRFVRFFADGERGFAVGEGGTIFATSDGGRSWVAQIREAEKRLRFVHFLADGQRGWAVGMEGSIIATVDGGSNWEIQRKGSVEEWLRFVQFMDDGQHGWAVGVDGVLATEDGGRNWVAQSIGFDSFFQSAYFLADGKHAWVVGTGGVIITTKDGGRIWTVQSSDTKESLQSVYFLADGLHGWVVGNGGSILTTDDGGYKWVKQNSGVEEMLESVHFLDNGQHGWAVGSDGTILFTRNGGKTWLKQVVGIGTNLSSIRFSEDGKSGVITGRGVIMYSHDGGKSWQMPQYHRSLAPWVYVTWLGIFLFTLLALLIERKIRHEDTVADLLVSDEPVTLPEDDRLGHRELVAALSAFLRNRRTVPPISVAITAPWGKGKSSVMRLLSLSMQRHGASTVWFNAWHHQKEEIILAALLENIRAQALPFWLTAWGLWFRFVLLFQRVVRHYAIAGLVGTLVWFGVAVLFEHGDKLPHAWQAIHFQPLLQLEWKDFIMQLYKTVADHPQLIHVVVGLSSVIGAVVFTLLYGMRAFPEHPAVLLATLSEKFKTSHVEAQTVFRYKFARHFGDVCNALRPRTLTIFIDDLDRCSPEKALETLEAVNYLVSSGACYVVLGMDKKVVESLVGLASEKLAKEMMVEAAAPNGDSNGKPDESVVEEVEKRRTYARQYLEKLVNFELPVPTVEPGGYFKLARQRREWRLALLHDINLMSLRLFGPFLFAVVVGTLVAAFFVGWKPAPAVEKAELLTTAVVQSPTDKAKLPPPDLAAKPKTATSPTSSGFVPADPLNDYEFWVWIIAIVAIYSVFFLPATRGRYVVDDSPAFRKALEIWLPLAVARRDSPRQAKRFVNHARFLAMRSRGTEAENGWREKLIFLEAYLPGAWKRLLKKSKQYQGMCLRERLRSLNLLRRRAVKLWSANKGGLPPEMLVALAAISYAFPRAIGYDGLEQFDFEMVWKKFAEDNFPAADAIYSSAWKRHTSTFSSRWPPTPEEMEIFRKWMDVLRQA